MDMNYISGAVRKRGLYIVICSFGIFCYSAKGQTGADSVDVPAGKEKVTKGEIEKKGLEQQVLSWQSQTKFYPGLLPTFFEKDSTKGSPYLSPYWMMGVLELSDHRRIPKLNEYLYFNYDKYNHRLILINKENKIWSYPVDSISGFALTDGEKVYSFEKLHSISNNFFLESVLKSETGYSLYKRLITKLVSADYQSEGYWSSGQKRDEYTDDYEYYLIYPDKRSYKKFYLNENAIHKAFKGEIVFVKDYLKPPVTENQLVSMIEVINASIPY
jgi:hypothetical protein